MAGVNGRRTGNRVWGRTFNSCQCLVPMRQAQHYPYLGPLPFYMSTLLPLTLSPPRT